MDKNQTGILLLFFLISFVFIPVLTYCYITDSLIRFLVYVSFSGALGALIYCIRGFYQHIAKNDFDDKWDWWYVFRPLIGFIAGIYAYFILCCLISMNTSQINLIPGDPRCFCGISFLSGFCFTQFVEKICKIYEILE